jgi:Zn finger protein HypA/HybF involved in hydrogenase expression
MPLATYPAQSLADAVAETMAAALAGVEEPCLWCGGGPVRVTSVDIWTGEAKVLCPQCGSELTAIVPRHGIEVRR